MYTNFFRPDRAGLKYKIALEYAMAKAMLEECASNMDIKKAYQELADVLVEPILKPLRKAALVVNKFEKIEPAEFREAITILAEAHSAQGKQYGGILKAKYPTAQEILGDIKKVRHLLKTLKTRLTNIEYSMNTVEDAAQVLKVFADLGYGFLEKLPSLYPEGHQKEALMAIKNMIWPSPEELNVRISWAEGEQKIKYATKLGIGREDLVNDEEVGKRVHYHAGKAVYQTVDMEMRIRLTAKAYDKLYSELQLAQRGGNLEAIDEAAKAFEVFKAKQKYNFGSRWLKIFLDKQDEPGGASLALMDMKRNKLRAYKRLVRSFEPSSVKLAKSTRQPLVASVSGSTARPIIALEYYGAFTKPDLSFDFDKLQYLANGIGGLFGMAGHHGVDEVAGVQNTTIDRVILHTPERIPSGLRAEMSAIENHPRKKNKMYAVESLFPYYKPGNEGSFFHEGYRERILAKAEAEVARESEQATVAPQLSLI